MTRDEILTAVDRTLDLGRANGMENCESDNPSVDWPHLLEMREQMQDFTDEGKLNRWLGWIQAAVVAGCFGNVTLEHMKENNR